MSSARRPLLTAAAAASLLGALWFVPSANATPGTPASPQPTTTAKARAGADPGGSGTTSADMSAELAADAVPDGVRLADTGSFDTTPYVAGGTLFLAVGAGFVVYSARRERLGL
ncbi:LAETG motif-containing sortase-dependent surface protein [Streptomyces sp. MS06]|uniref:LAETG motif-containing sortase-dependent surface protein n=1 Tax=Streptomyces sp. MS06 TaxID=3385974 RepID=UPI00399FB61D